MTSIAEIECGSRPVRLKIQGSEAYGADSLHPAGFSRSQVLDSAVEHHMMFPAEPLVMGKVVNPFRLFYTAGNVAKHDLIIAWIEADMEAFSSRYKCPRCGGKVADGKYLGYEAEAYCLDCRHWIDFEDLVEREVDNDE